MLLRILQPRADDLVRICDSACAYFGGDGGGEDLPHLDILGLDELGRHRGDRHRAPLAPQFQQLPLEILGLEVLFQLLVQRELHRDVQQTPVRGHQPGEERGDSFLFCDLRHDREGAYSVVLSMSSRVRYRASANDPDRINERRSHRSGCNRRQ